MIVAILVIVIGFLPKALGEPGLLDMPGVTPEQAGRLLPASAAFGGRCPSWKCHLAVEQAKLPVIAEAAEGITDSRGMLIRRPKVWPHGKNHKRVKRACERMFDKVTPGQRARREPAARSVS